MQNKEVKFIHRYWLTIDFLVMPLIFIISAYIIFNRFIRLNFMIDDIDYLEALIVKGHNPLSFIRNLAMRPICFKPVSLGINWLMNFKLFGLNPHGYHLFNIAIHSLNSFILYLLIRVCFKQRPLGFFVSFCYLAHPFNIQAMTWISAGFTSQCVVLFFCITLVTLYLYIKNPMKIFIILSYLSFLCAFLSREDMILAPLVIFYFFELFLKEDTNKAKFKVMLGYVSIPIFIMAGRLFLLYPKVFDLYRWDYTNIQNALFRTTYYFLLALSPLKNLLGRSIFNFLAINKIVPVISFKIILYALLIPIYCAIYKNRNKEEVRLFIFGAIWYLVFSVPFIFMVGFLEDRYLSVSIIGIYMALAGIIAAALKLVLKNNVYARMVILFCFTTFMLLIANYMVAEEFTKNPYTRANTASQYYIAKINAAIRNNLRIKNVRLLGFPEVLRYPRMLRLRDKYYKNINFNYADSGCKDDKDKESSLTVKYSQ